MMLHLYSLITAGSEGNESLLVSNIEFKPALVKIHEPLGFAFLQSVNADCAERGLEAGE